MKSIAFGWELNSASNNGADLFTRIKNDITVTGISMDVAFMITSANWLTSGFAEVLCTASLSPVHPAFAAGSPAYSTSSFPQSDFGPAQFYVPNPSIGCHGGLGGGGALASAILKTWVGNANATARNVTVTGLQIPASKDSFLVLHMDHMGITGDVEMQGVLFYQ